MTNVFSDFHHGDLFHSLHLLFEKRLGYQLFRPIGLSWYPEYWHIADPYAPNHMPTVQQYLSISPQQMAFFANKIEKVEDGVYYCWQPSQETYHKAITLEKFKEMQIDIVISSIPSHDIAYADLIKKYKPNAKHIAQMGNVWGETSVKNIMCSFPASLAKVRSDQNVVFYNQEFDLNIFKYTPPSNRKKITSFVNCLPMSELYHQFKFALPEFEFKAHGASCPDECIAPLSRIAQIMQESMWGYHVKPGGDGYGHVLFNWLAVGRPLIIDMRYYRHRRNLLIDRETCIDIGRRSFEESVRLIREYSEPSIHRKMCENVHKVFVENVNFDEDERKVRAFLEKML